MKNFSLKKFFGDNFFNKVNKSKPTENINKIELEKNRMKLEKNKKSENYKTTNLIFCGNANTGKSTVFNKFAKANAHIGNWLGVTVDVENKSFIKNEVKYNCYDLPGTASLTPTSIDETNAVEFLKSHKVSTIVNVVDANNLKRNLYLTLELLEQGYKVCMLINFKKSFDKQKGKLDINKLAKTLQIPIVCSPNEIIEGKSVHMPICRDAYTRHLNVSNILKDCYTSPHKAYGTSRLDKLLLNKFFAIPCFALVLLSVFFLTFVLVPKLFEVPFDKFVILLNSLSSGDFYQTVIVGSLTVILEFLPQIVTILLCINILENSGYISRLAFVFEDIFEKIGLSGKSIFPILMSLGCASVATPFCKGIADKNTRLKTCSILSFFPCSAKLPIIMLFLSLISNKMITFSICIVYVVCIMVALIFCSLLNKKYPSEKSNLILEFPAMRIIGFKQIFKNVWDSLKSLLSRIVFIIIVVNIIVYCLNLLNIFNILIVIPNLILSIFGFSPEAVSALVSGILGKELIATSLSGVALGDIFSSSTIVLFLVFAMFYTPCASTTGLFIEQFGIKQTSKILLMQFTFTYILTCLLALVFNPSHIVSYLLVLSVIGTIMLIVSLTKAKHGGGKLSCKNCHHKCRKNICNK